MKNTILFTVGVSASGKTYWTEAFVKDNPDWININRDDIRWSLFTNGVADWSLYKFKKSNEKAVTEHQETLIKVAVAQNKDIIISNTNLHPKYIDVISSLPCLKDYKVETKMFHVDFLEALKRDARRLNGVGYEVITKQYQAYAKLKWGAEWHVHEPRLHGAFICDLDGTICNMKGVRTPYEWDKVGLDKPRVEIISMVKGLINDGYYPIFVSGRDAVCMNDTAFWIEEQFDLGSSYHLFMRPKGDFRKDTIVKKEIFNKYIRGNYTIHVVLDDRPSVSRMFRYELGLNVISVADPHNEF